MVAVKKSRKIYVPGVAGSNIPWLRYMFYGLSVLFFIIVSGTFIFWLLGQYYDGIDSQKKPWQLNECLYMVVITVTTIGFEDILHTFNYPLAQAFMTLLTFVGVGVPPFMFTMITGMIVDGLLLRALEGRLMEKRILALRKHVVVCGAGETGLHAIEELHRTGIDFIIIESDEERLKYVLQHVGPCPYLVGDATLDEVMASANIAHARGMISTLSSDKDNLFTVITARSLNADMYIVSRVVDPGTEAKLLKAGANRVVNPNIIGGMRMASEIIRPETVTFLDAMLRQDNDIWRFQEMIVGAGAPLDGKTLADSGIREAGNLSVIAIRERDTKQFSYNPPHSALLKAGSVVVLLVNSKDLHKVRAKFEGA